MHYTSGRIIRLLYYFARAPTELTKTNYWIDKLERMHKILGTRKGRIFAISLSWTIIRL